MEEIIPGLKGMLKDATKIKSDAAKLEIIIEVLNNVNGDIAEPDEVLIMLKMFGGLKEEVPMEINIDNTTQTISMQFQNEEDYKKIQQIMDNLWDNTVDIFIQAMEGDLSRIKDIPNIDD